MKPALSVVIPVYGSGAWLEDLVAAGDFDGISAKVAQVLAWIREVRAENG